MDEDQSYRNARIHHRIRPDKTVANIGRCGAHRGQVLENTVQHEWLRKRESNVAKKRKDGVQDVPLERDSQRNEQAAGLVFGRC